MPTMTDRARRGAHLLLASVLTLTLALAACGDGDDDDDATPAATITPAAATTATATAPSGAGGDAASPSADEEQSSASPTAADEPVATATEAVDPTATSADEATATAPVGIPDETPTAGAGEPTATSAATTELEQQLLDALLTTDDFPDGWLVEDAEIVAPDTTDGEELCDAEPFPREAEALGQAQVSFGDDAQSVFALHKLIAYPDEATATDALAHQREAFVCPNWTDADGALAGVTPVDVTLAGVDEVAAADASVTFQEPALTGRWLYARVGQVVLVFARVHEAERDNADLDAALALAVERAVALDETLRAE